MKEVFYLKVGWSGHWKTDCNHTGPSDHVGVCRRHRMRLCMSHRIFPGCVIFCKIYMLEVNWRFEHTLSGWEEKVKCCRHLHNLYISGGIDRRHSPC